MIYYFCEKNENIFFQQNSSYQLNSFKFIPAERMGKLAPMALPESWKNHQPMAVIQLPQYRTPQLSLLAATPSLSQT
jgi:hypothetical protein